MHPVDFADQVDRMHCYHSQVCCTNKINCLCLPVSMPVSVFMSVSVHVFESLPEFTTHMGIIKPVNNLLPFFDRHGSIKTDILIPEKNLDLRFVDVMHNNVIQCV